MGRSSSLALFAITGPFSRRRVEACKKTIALLARLGFPNFLLSGLFVIFAGKPEGKTFCSYY